MPALFRITTALVVGAFTWTLLEYCIHRWLGHKYRRNPFGAEHTRHHSQGGYFAPAWKKGGAAVVTALIVGGPAVMLLGQQLGVAYTTGLVSFYLVYELLHRREHTHSGFGRYGRWIRRLHFFHHFANPSKNHGVTSPFWDHVFRTYENPGVIRVPRKLQMVWLTDKNGEVLPAFAEHYRLR